MPRKLKILTIYYKHKRGGFCKRIRKSMEAYIEAGWEVHYLAVSPYPYTLDGLKPHILPCPFSRHEGLFFWMYFFITAPIYALLLGVQHRFSLISSVSPVYAWIAKPLRRFRRIPMVTFLFTKPRFTTDCHDKYSHLSRLETCLETKGLEASDLVIANSSGCREAWIEEHGSSLERIGVQPNDVRMKSFNKLEKRQELIDRFQLPAEAFIFASAGLFEPHKNFEFLIRAFARLENTKAILILYGEGVLQSSLEALAKTLGVSDQIIFPGWKDDVENQFGGVDVFVFPSLREGMSEALLEAGSCQNPCLVSAIPENTEVIQNHNQHFPPDNIEALHNLMARCMRDETFYREISKQSLKDIQRFEFNWNETLTETVRDKLLTPS